MRLLARLARALRHPFAPRTSGRAAQPLPPDLRTLLMTLSANAQAIVDAANELPAAIDAYTAGRISDAEAALAAQHTEDLQGIDAALAGVAAKVAPTVQPPAGDTADQAPAGAVGIG